MEDACIKVDSLMKMPLQYIVNSVIGFYGCDTMLLSPDPIPSETDTKNDNNSNNNQKRRNKPSKSGRLSKRAWKKQVKQGSRSTEAQKPIAHTLCMVLLVQNRRKYCVESRTNTILPMIIQ